MGAATGLELRHPGLEDFGGQSQHVQQCGRRGAHFMQPAVHDLFHRPGGFAQIGQAHHATAALQGMEAATQRDERGLVVWRGMHQRQMLVDGRQHFVGFFEEYGEQFRVELFFAGVHQSRGFGGRRRSFDGRGWRGCNNWRDFDRLDLEVRQCFFGRRGFGSQLVDRRGRGWRQKCRCNCLGLFVHGMRGGRRLKNGVDVGCATLQLRDKKAQRRKLLRHVFEIAGLRRESGFGEMLDGYCTFAEYGVGAVLTEYHQRALYLANRLFQCGQSGLARGVTEEGVQRLFNGAEIGTDFACHRFQQQAFLGTPGHGIEVRQFQCSEFFATAQRGETRDDGFRRVREVRVERLEVFQGRFGEQECGGHLQCHDLVVACRIAAQLVSLFENRCSQPHVAGLAGGGALFGNLRHAFVERRQCGGGTRAQAVPVILCGGQQFTQTTNVRQQPFGFGWRCGGHHAVQAIGGTHDGQCFAARRGAGRLVKRFAQQRLVCCGLAVDELLDLRPKAHGKSLGFRQIGQSVCGECIEHAQRDPPVGAGGGGGARHFDHGHRDFHLGDALGIILDPLQQAAFKAQARGLESRRESLRGQRRGFFFALRRALGEIGEKQFGRPRSRQAARHHHRAVGEKQPQRLVRVACHQVVEIAAQRCKAALRRCNCGTDILGCVFAQRCQQLLDRVGEFRNSVEADDSQRAMRLVHAGARLLQVIFRGTGCVGGEAHPGAFQGKVDFPLDPGQRSDVEIHAHEKLFTTSWFMCPLITP